MTKLLLDHGADVNAQVQGKVAKTLETPLMLACGAGIMKSVVYCGVNSAVFPYGHNFIINVTIHFLHRHLNQQKDDMEHYFFCCQIQMPT